jgi:hypothetical protein
MAEVLAKYEKRDLSPPVVVGFALGIVITLLMIFAGIVPFERGLNRQRDGERAERTSTAERVAPAPALQTSPAGDLRAQRSKEEATLGSYGWIDRQAGVIRIPIERAIELTAERGLPARGLKEPQP